MQILDLIEKKKLGQNLTKEEINFMITNFVNKNIPDYQMSAMLMAICLKGMTDEEATNLALAMRDSGDIYDLSKIPGIKVDKHSTGGVGDTVTLVLGPMVAACGAKFAKMSGRGLGHTGGTLDKLEAIPGFNIEQSLNNFVKQVNKIGIAVIGQSSDITPADKYLYALRDVTATVDSKPLIASSIMSKKLASGSDAIVLDVTMGSGAFMTNLKDATELAKLMVSIGNKAGKKTTAVITNMDEPLGNMIGNSLEVYEALQTLKGNGPKDLLEVSLTIGSLLLVDANISKSLDDARKKLLEVIKDGTALNKFYELVKAQGGDVEYCKDLNNFLKASKKEVKALKDGYISKMNTTNIGEASRLLGAGRLTKEDKLDLEVGIDLKVKIGNKVKKGDTIAILYHNKKGLKKAEELLLDSIEISNKKITHKLIEKIIK